MEGSIGEDKVQYKKRSRASISAPPRVSLLRVSSSSTSSTSLTMTRRGSKLNDAAGPPTDIGELHLENKNEDLYIALACEGDDVYYTMEKKE